MSLKQNSGENKVPAEIQSTDRRKMVKMLLAAGPAISLMAASGQVAAEQSAEKVPVDDPLASALGYIEDATKVDREKYPAYQPGQTCQNCILYPDPTADEWGPCTLFQNRLVAADGWCVSWAKRPG